MATFLAGLAFMLLSQAAIAWGPLGHRAIGAMADALHARGPAELALRQRAGLRGGSPPTDLVPAAALRQRADRGDARAARGPRCPACATPRRPEMDLTPGCRPASAAARSRLCAGRQPRARRLRRRRRRVGLDAARRLGRAAACLRTARRQRPATVRADVAVADRARASRARGFARSAGRPVAERIEPACARRRARLPFFFLRRGDHRDGFVAARLPAARRARDHIAAGAGGRTAGDDIESGLDRAVALQPPASVRPDDRSDHAAPAPRAAARLVARRWPAAAFAPVDAQAPAGASALVLELPDAPALAGASAVVLDPPDAAGPAGASALVAELPDEPALVPDPADTSSPGVNPAGRPRSREHPDARAAARW